MNHKTDTPELIRKLRNDLATPSEGKSWPRWFWFSWSGLILLFAGMTFYFAMKWPVLAYLPSNPARLNFMGGALLWLGISSGAAWIAFQSAYPDDRHSTLSTAVVIALVGMVGWAFLYSVSPEGMGHDFRTELDPGRGPCGGFILMSGALSASWMLLMLRRAAPTRLAYTGAWCALSSGSFASFCMHLVCRYESPAHVLLWHLTPLLVLGVVGAQIGRKVLSW